MAALASTPSRNMYHKQSIRTKITISQLIPFISWLFGPDSSALVIASIILATQSVMPLPDTDV